MQLSTKQYRHLMTAPLVLAVIAISVVSHMPQPPHPDLGIALGDKVLHALAYAFLGLIFVAAADANRKISGRRLALWTFTFCALFGIYDELHQSFIPGRFADVFDWLADCFGGLVAAAFSGRFQVLLQRIRLKLCTS